MTGWVRVGVLCIGRKVEGEKLGGTVVFLRRELLKLHFACLGYILGTLCCGGKSSPGLVTWSWRRRVVERRHCGTDSARVWIWFCHLLAV